MDGVVDLEKTVPEINDKPRAKKRKIDKKIEKIKTESSENDIVPMATVVIIGNFSPLGISEFPISPCNSSIVISS
jgi:hypothetical protein